MDKWVTVCSTQIIHTQQTKWTKYNYIPRHRCILQNNVEQNISDTKEYILFYPIYREFKRDKQWIMLEVRIMVTFGELSHILFLQVAQSVKRICLQYRRPGFNPWVKKIPRRRKSKPLRYSCLGNPMDREA